MKAEKIYSSIQELSGEEAAKLFRMLKRPLPRKSNFQWIYQWEGLSQYLGGVPINTLKDWEKAGLFTKHKGLGRKVFFKPEEIDQALTNYRE